MTKVPHDRPHPGSIVPLDMDTRYQESRKKSKQGPYFGWAWFNGRVSGLGEYVCTLRWLPPQIGVGKNKVIQLSVIIIHLFNGKKGELIFTRADLLDYRLQSSICGHKVHKVAQNSNVNYVLPNVFAHIDGILKRLLECQADIICAHNVREMSESARNFGWKRSHCCGLWSRKKTSENGMRWDRRGRYWEMGTYLGVAFAFTTADEAVAWCCLLWASHFAWLVHVSDCREEGWRMGLGTYLCFCEVAVTLVVVEGTRRWAGWGGDVGIEHSTETLTSGTCSSKCCPCHVTWAVT